MRTQSEDAVHVARTSPGLQHFNTLVPSPYEDRTIVVAQGMQFQDNQLPEEWRDVRMRNFLSSRIPDINFSDDRHATYISHMQGVRFTLRIIVRKDEFKQALETPGIHVVYDGHARYGRGPCFGSNGGSDDVWQQKNRSEHDEVVPGEDWENGTDPNVSGIFRMGYPLIPIPVSEIIEHGYTANLLRAAEPLNWEDCHPAIQNTLSQWRRFTLDALDSSGELGRHVAGQPSATEEFWGRGGSLDGERGPHVIIRAGWTETVSNPMDLGATNVRCRVFCHFGCSTLKHNRRILREFKNWQQTGDDHFAFWTSAPSDMRTRLWIYHILTYPTYNAFQSWQGSLDYAVRRTNQDLRNMSAGYQIV